MIVIVLDIVVALLFAAEEGSVNAQQLVARRLRQRRNVIAIADGSLDNDSKRTSRSRTLSSSTATAAVTTPHHTSSRRIQRRAIMHTFSIKMIWNIGGA